MHTHTQKERENEEVSRDEDMKRVGRGGVSRFDLNTLHVFVKFSINKNLRDINSQQKNGNHEKLPNMNSIAEKKKIQK